MPQPPIPPEKRDAAIALWRAGETNKSKIGRRVGLNRGSVFKVLTEEFGEQAINNSSSGSVSLVIPPTNESGSAAGGGGGAADADAAAHAAAAGDDGEDAEDDEQQGAADGEAPPDDEDEQWADPDGDGDEQQELEGDEDDEERAEARLVQPGERSRMVMGGWVSRNWIDPDDPEATAGLIGQRRNGGAAPPPPPVPPPGAGGQPFEVGPPRADGPMLVQDLTLPVPQDVISMWFLCRQGGYTGTLADWIFEAVDGYIVDTLEWRMAIIRPGDGE